MVVLCCVHNVKHTTTNMVQKFDNHSHDTKRGHMSTMIKQGRFEHFSEMLPVIVKVTSIFALVL